MNKINTDNMEADNETMVEVQLMPCDQPCGPNEKKVKVRDPDTGKVIGCICVPK